MVLYEKLSKIKFLRNSYVLKFLFVAFIGIHIPLIGILFFVLFEKANFTTTSLLIFSLVMTLIATAITLLVLKKLIQPIELASKALNDYKLKRIIKDLPTNFSDEAGLLLFNIHNSILESETFIKEKQDLIYLLSHDLKTFAGNPQSLAKLILDSNPTENIKELAEMICESTSEQFQYIENFIKMLKEQDEMLKIGHEVKTINLKDLINTVKNQEMQFAQEKKIKFVEQFELTKADLLIDKELLTRVIYNLVNNAIKFSFSDSEIRIHTYQDDKCIYLKVIDHGVGFNNSDSQKIFDKFTNMSRLGTFKEASTGIGMYLSRQIIERNKGSLLASSQGINMGATFTIVFQKKII